MAEAFVNSLAGDRFYAESAGLESRDLNQLVIDVMRQVGLDISKNKPNSVFGFYKEGRLYDYVIYVCERETEERCPVFPGLRRALNWPFPDPAKLSGTYEERLRQTRKIRDEIKERVERWIKEFV
jgi:arsenate reductase